MHTYGAVALGFFFGGVFTLVIMWNKAERWAGPLFCFIMAAIFGLIEIFN